MHVHVYVWSEHQQLKLEAFGFDSRWPPHTFLFQPTYFPYFRELDDVYECSSTGGCYHWCSSTVGCYHQCSSTGGCYHWCSSTVGCYHQCSITGGCYHQCFNTVWLAITGALVQWAAIISALVQEAAITHRKVALQWRNYHRGRGGNCLLAFLHKWSSFV